MYISDLKDKEEIIAGDKTILRQLLHPGKANLAINFSLAHAVVKPGDCSQIHSLNATEVYYILEGEGEMHINEEKENVRPGQAIYIPANAKQFIKNIGLTDLKFICIVDPPWSKENEDIY